MTRTIFGRRQAVLRQRARQEAWRLALRSEIETRRNENEAALELENEFEVVGIHEEAREGRVAVVPTIPAWKRP
jgi:hypothetical protein